MAEKTTIATKKTGDKLTAAEFNQLNNNFNDSVEELNLKNGFLERNKDVFPALSNLFKYSDISIIHVSDVHEKANCLENMVELYEKFDAVAGSKKIIKLFGGDMAHYGPTTYDWTNFLDLLNSDEIYPVLGQHETGYTKVIDECWTDSEVYTNLIVPVKTALGLTTTKNYWYKDFDSKLRVISLYQYEIPPDVDSEDATLYKYLRSYIWYSQAQIDWLIAILNSTPEDYGVVIAMHQTDSLIVSASDDSPFHRNMPSRNKVINGDIIKDIVEAWINRTTIDTTYTSSIGLTVDAVGNFASANGIFFHYAIGDSHNDSCGYFDGTTQRAIIVSSPKSPYDMTQTNESEKAYDVINVYGYNFDNNTISLVRVGANSSKYMQDRRFQLIEIV